MPKRSLLPVLVAVGLLSLGAACSPSAPPVATLTTDTKSSKFSSDKDKVLFLTIYLRPLSPIAAAEYHIRYHDNSTGMIPSPSDWDIRAVMKVNPKDIDQWTKNLPPANREVPLDWGRALLPPKADWETTSRPRIFHSSDGRTVVAVFAPEGIVFKKVVSEPPS
ncbi:MAG: hypothetical protein H7Z41_00430 [Cytophagales bacterium]|nr:hypothetical protein [Armatimonadota bacterium]